MKVKVWDGWVRVFHWALGLAVLGAFLTSEEDEWLPTHMRVGVVVLGLVVFRLAWGLWGSRHARFSDFVRTPRQVLAYARGYVRGKVDRHLGHNPLGGAMVVAFLLVLVGLAGTGILMSLGSDWDGALSGVITRQVSKDVEEVHEALAGALLVMIGAHVAGVVLSSIIERQNLVLGMITGRKRGDGGETAEPARRGLALRLTVALLLAFAVVRGLFGFLPVAEASAATRPEALIERYATAARQESADFDGFSAERGRALYQTEHDVKGKPTSCATCHGVDPKRPGRTPAGKRLDAFAPSVTPDRFTDEANVEKWFLRNCKQVYGRACTAREKGDLLTWLSTK